MIKRRYVLAWDQGTTSSRAMLFRDDGTLAAEGHAPLPLEFPQPGWVEVDGEALFSSQWQATVQCLARMQVDPAWSVDQIVAIGIANQRETTLLWERETGRLVHPAIIWQCRRSAGIAAAWAEAGLAPLIHQRTGLHLDPYFSATKLAFIFQTYPDLRRRAERGELCFGTVDSFLLARLTGLREHFTDVSNASRTAFFNLAAMAWDEDLLRRMAIAPKILPTVVDTAGDIAVTDPSWFGRAIPITSLVGDQQAALFGQGCFREGLAKCTIGTGAFVLAHAGSELPSATPELIRTVAWRQAGRKTVYAWEGAVFTAGSLINWLRDGLEIIERPEDTARIAAAVDDCGGVVMVPAFSGLATPYWDPAARGLLVGMTSKTTRAHVVRAALESIAMQIVDVLMSMEHASRAELASVQVDGGVAQNAVVLQSLADLSDRPIHRHAMAEATARGACWLAGLAAGLWSSEEVLPVDSWGETTRFQPHLGSSERAAQYHRWQQAVARSRGWADMPEAEAP